MHKILFILLTCLSLTAIGQERYEITHLNDSINTIGSETGAIVVDDSILLYTSMDDGEPSRQYLIEFNPMLNQIYQAKLNDDGSIGHGEINRWGLNASGNNNGNVAYDVKNDIIYITRSDARSGSVSHIYYTHRKQGRWNKLQPLGGYVNLKGYNSTHPAIGYLPTGETILYFSSDRPDGLGGMDIWYAIIISEGKPGNCTNLGAPVNSDSNEVTPFYCNEEGTLYFSSNRKDGMGGYDIYRSNGYRNNWQLPQTLGSGINSKYNDLFFTFQPCNCRCKQDSIALGEEVEACGFFASNRPGSLFKDDSNCCNDLFSWRRIRKIIDLPAAKIDPNVHCALDLLPLSLYFHNDEPTAKTLDTTTRLDYSTTYRSYLQRRDEYKGAQSSPADRRKWDSIQNEVDFFFDHQLADGHAAMLQLIEFIYQDLKAGHAITITIDGYASPLFESLYNINLSKRRIDCFKNQLKRWHDEALLPYLNNGMLKLEMVANGAPGEEEVAASDPLRNPLNAKSVYSMNAAKSRRIDIVGYQLR